MGSTFLRAIGCLIYIPLIAHAYCNWPQYLHPGSSWRYRFRHGGADLRGNPAAIVAIQTRVINFNFQDIGADTPNSFQWKCESPVSGIDNLYLVSKSYFSTPDHAAEQLEFMCIRITARGSSVLQLEMTASWFDNPDANVCHNKLLRPHPWLLLSDSPPEPQACPLVGGYDLRLYDSTTKEYCPGVYNPARLESQCDIGESMVINFQDCPHNLLVENMQRYQPLECLTHWVQQGFVFIVLFSSPNQGFWTLRLPQRFQQTSVFNSVLLSDVIYDPSEMIDPRFSYVNLQMNHVIYDSLCADASPSCGEDSVDIVCAPDNMFGHIFCKRTCNKCPVHITTEACEFHASYMTVWRPLFMRSNETNADRSRSTLFSIANGYIEYGHRGQLTCIQQEQNLGYMRYALADVKQNGCAPRFHCLLMDSLTSNLPNAPPDHHARHGHHAGRVVAYKTEQGAIWPDFEEAFYCNARMTGNGVQETFWDFAVSGSRRLRPSRCDLEYIAYNFKETFTSGDTCEGTLTKQYCSHDSTLFKISPTKCSNEAHQRTVTYSCLLSFEQTLQGETDLSSRIIVIQPSGLPNHDYMCLVIQQGPKPVLLMHRRECLEFYFYDLETSHAHLQLFPNDELCISGEQGIVGGHGDATRLSSLLWLILLCIFPLKI